MALKGGDGGWVRVVLRLTVRIHASDGRMDGYGRGQDNEEYGILVWGLRWYEYAS